MTADGEVVLGLMSVKLSVSSAVAISLAWRSM
jgi:hypothetical protein